MKKIKMNLGGRSYPIFIGKDASKVLGSTAKGVKVFIMGDSRLSAARKKLVKLFSKKGAVVFDFPVKAGEGLKDIRSVYPIYGQLLKKGANRHSVLIALGGGSVGDVAGFIAATYMRGIEWIGVPTTLLAQVDSSVGGKTGINHTVGKNLIGAFHQPSTVIVDTQFLKTLSQREVVSGMGEMVKYALTFDPKFFVYLEKNLNSLLKLEEITLQHSIERSLQWKCKAVSRDEFDETGVREVLNFGHTFGHALESATNYKIFQHGEAVIWGMRFALALSVQRKKLSAKDRARMDALLKRLPVPAIPSKLKATQIFEKMKMDKKARGNSIRFVLLDRVGHAVLDTQVTAQDLEQAHRMLFKHKGPKHG